MSVPRLRVFAGPNGSGKSTIKDVLPAHLIYIYVNADEIEKEVKATGRVDLTPFEVATSQDIFQAFFANHGLVLHAGLKNQVGQIAVDGQFIVFNGIVMNSYHASVIADFIRHELIARKASFTFETVMSSPDKVEFIKMARTKGYRTYLYFVATEDPAININRVANRVSDGGHGVPEDKIVERYWRTLGLLPEAIQASSRAYLFDNSGDRAVLEVEITDSEEAEFKIDNLHSWCMTALEALASQPAS